MKAVKEPLTTVRAALTWMRTTRNPAFLVTVAFMGLALMIGGPLVAEDRHADTQTHGDAHGSAVEEHGVAGHGDAHGAAVEEHGSAGHGDAHGAAADRHGSGDHGDAGHGEGHGGGGGVEHFPTLIAIIANAFDGHKLHHWTEATDPVARNLLRFEDVIYSAVLIVLLTILFSRATRNLQMVPGPLQNFAEFLIGGLDSFIRGVIGPEGRKYVPFLGTVGLYIYVMNIFGLVPLMKSPTSVLNTTAAMAITVFLYVQWTGFRTNGVAGYLKHLAGDPKDVVGWCMVPLMLPLHIIGELAKPLSLGLRLFGNIMGEELLLAVFAGLGVAMVAAFGLPYLGIPLHLPFMFLGLLTTLIQAVVFMLLSTIYIALVLPHHDHGEHGSGAH